MPDHKIVKRGLIALIILGIFVLSFLVLQPIVISIILGLLFAYLFSPVYKLIRRVVPGKTLATFILMLALTVVIVVPLIYLTPLIINQTFETYVSLQGVDFADVLNTLIGEQMASTIAINLDNLIGQIFSGFLNQFTELLVNLPSLLLQFAVFLFTFFFALRDMDPMKRYMSTLSPFSSATEAKFMKELRGITNAIVYGQVFIGIVQGLALGAGLFFLGVPNALILTVIASILSIIPILGSWIVWVPVGAFLLVSGDTFAGVFLLLYGALFVSTIDNLIRPYILSKQSNLPVALSVIGTIGGLYMFGILGLVLGPLILAYALIIIEFYRKGKLKELFTK